MQRSGYVVTVLGMTIGATGLACGFGFVAAYLVMYGSPNDEWAGLGAAVVGGTVGAIVGSGTGAWLALRWRGYERAGLTGLAAAIVGPGWLWLSFFLTTAICNSTGCRGAFDGQATILGLAIGGFVIVAALSRWAVLRLPARP